MEASVSTYGTVLMCFAYPQAIHRVMRWIVGGCSIPLAPPGQDRQNIETPPGYFDQLHGMLCDISILYFQPVYCNVLSKFMGCFPLGKINFSFLGTLQEMELPVAVRYV